MRKSYVSSLLIISLWLLVACQSTNSSSVPQLGDGGLLSHNPCGPPCFQHITVGIDYNSAVDHVNAVPGVDTLRCKEHSGVNAKDYTCKGIFIAATSENTSSYEVISISYDLQSEITIEEIIDAFGIPDRIDVVEVGSTEHPLVVMDLLYNEFALFIRLKEQDALETGREYLVNELTLAEKVSYVSQERYQQLANDTIMWAGYKSYDVLP